MLSLVLSLSLSLPSTHPHRFTGEHRTGIATLGKNLPSAAAKAPENRQRGRTRQVGLIPPELFREGRRAGADPLVNRPPPC